MQTDTNPTRLAVDEYAVARATGLSVHTLRKDRVSARRFPYFKVGARVLYSLDRVREALASFEQGGPTVQRPRRKA